MSGTAKNAGFAVFIFKFLLTKRGHKTNISVVYEKLQVFD